MTTEDDIWRDLLAALEQHSGDDDTRTTYEIMEKWDCTEYTARKRLKVLHKMGQIEPVRIQRENMWGILTTVNGWRLIKE